MDERLVGELEAAVADAGTYLVQLDKFRLGRQGVVAELRQAVLTLGDRARRLHHRGTLDPAAAGPLLAEAHLLLSRLGVLLADVRAGSDYRTATLAHATGAPELARVLAALFAGVEAVPRPPELFGAVPWLRRGRPRAAPELAGEVARTCHDGLAAYGDDLAPGVDPSLPAVALQVAAPPDEPVLLCFAGSDLPTAVCRLVDTEDYLVHVPRLVAPHTLLVRRHLEADDAGVDYPTYRAELVGALTALGLAFRDL